MTQISDGGVLNAAVKETNFNFEGQTAFYRGKVRDVYDFGDKVVMVASDRISKVTPLIWHCFLNSGESGKRKEPPR